MKPYEIAEQDERDNIFPSWKPGADKVEHATTRNKYRMNNSIIREQFSTNLRAEYAPDLPEMVALDIFSRSWQNGHSEGYSRVEEEFEELAEFARFARSAE